MTGTAEEVALMTLILAVEEGSRHGSGRVTAMIAANGIRGRDSEKLNHSLNLNPRGKE